jgi:hypothetical protein
MRNILAAAITAGLLLTGSITAYAFGAGGGVGSGGGGGAGIPLWQPSPYYAPPGAPLAYGWMPSHRHHRYRHRWQ